MASSSLLINLIAFSFILLVSLTSPSRADDGSLSFQIADDDLELPSSPLSHLNIDLDNAADDIDGDEARRSLFWRRIKYYISYGAMSANRVPCPPRSGRSYYTHNCHLARGPAHPYTRGCSTITRCRR